MIEVVLDIETADPDDFFCLLFLAGHPRVHLKAVTITPGGADQVGLIRWGLNAIGKKDIPIGVGKTKPNKQYVSSWHYHAFGHIPPSEQSQPAIEVLLEHCDENTVFVEGAPLKNIGAVLELKHFRLGTAVIMGGFAGESIVPPEQLPEQWKGISKYPSWNVGGACGATTRLLASQKIKKRFFVSKNVTHQVIYDYAMHEHLKPFIHNNQALELIWKGMNHYLMKHPEGKKVHDLLAAACAVDPRICQFKEVDIFYEKNGIKGKNIPHWGAREAHDTNTFISINYDPALFLAALEYQ